jgi:hypothetical protein
MSQIKYPFPASNDEDLKTLVLGESLFLYIADSDFKLLTCRMMNQIQKKKQKLINYCLNKKTSKD